MQPPPLSLCQNVSELLIFFPSPAVYGWGAADKISEPDLSGFVSRLSLSITEAR